MNSNLYKRLSRFLSFYRGKRRNTKDIEEKIEADNRPLKVSEVKYILSQDFDDFSNKISSNKDKWDLKKKIDSKITESLGHSCFRSILEDMEEKLSNDLRDDLIDPAKEPRKSDIGKESEGEYIYITENHHVQRTLPDKKPSKLYYVGESVLDYLICDGKGFYIANEIPGIYEEVYKEAYEVAGKTYEFLEDYNLKIEMDSDEEKAEVEIQITYSSEKNEFKKKFRQENKWFKSQALEPLQKAVSRESSKELYLTEDNGIKALEKDQYRFLKNTLRNIKLVKSHS